MFRMPKDAETWFRHISDQAPIKTMFDRYYLCVIAGLFASRRSDNLEPQEFYAEFPKEYDQSRYQILALLIQAERDREGLDFDNKAAIQSLISRVISPDSPSKLSSDGFSRINSYAAGGFGVLAESFESSPQDVSVFLTRYSEMFD